jgi:hypothetical protein
MPLSFSPLSTRPLSALPSSGVTLQYMRPIADIAANGWLPSVVAAPLYSMLNEVVEDDTNYIYSPENPTTQQFEVQLGFDAGGSDPGVDTNHSVDIAMIATNQDTTFDFDLVQGTTIIESWSEAVTVAAGVVLREHAFSPANIANITDYTDLRVRGVARAP